MLAAPVQVVGLKAPDEDWSLRNGAALVFDCAADGQHRPLRQRGDRQLRPSLGRPANTERSDWTPMRVDDRIAVSRVMPESRCHQHVADLFDVTSRVPTMAARPAFRSGKSVAPLPGREQGDAHLRAIGDIPDRQCRLERGHDVEVIMTTCTVSTQTVSSSSPRTRAMRCAVVLFHRDLRVHDHPALVAAVREADRVVPLFVVDDAILGGDFARPNRLQFLLDSLADLDRSLTGLGGRLSPAPGRRRDRGDGGRRGGRRRGGLRLARRQRPRPSPPADAGRVRRAGASSCASSRA